MGIPTYAIFWYVRTTYGENIYIPPTRGRLKLQTNIIRAPVKLHVRARFFQFARKFNSDSCMAAPYVQVRTKRRLRCPDQPDPRPDPSPNPNPNPTLWGARGLLSRLGWAVLSLRANLKTLHVRAIERLVI